MLRIIVATLTFLILDAVWLGYIGKQIYIKGIGKFLRLANGSIQPIWPAAIIVYIALILGILVFVIPKSHGLLLNALFWGAIFGFVTYATYDFTNMAVLNGWSWKISIIDTIWGMVICGVTSMVTALVSK